MAKSNNLVKFETLAALFLEFEREYNELPKEELNSFELDLQKEEFKSLWEKVKVAFEHFVTNKPSKDTDNDCEEAKKLYKECRLAYITVAAQMGELSQSFVNQSILSSNQSASVPRGFSTTMGSRNSSHHMKLPPCTMEVFKGDYKSWPSFRDMFTAVYINCDDLSDVQKLFYLRQFTSDEALEIVKNSPLTNQGFMNAWVNLTDAYENERILVNSQLKILFNLAQVKTESAKDIKRLQRDINNCISIFNLHNIDISTWDPIFVYLCSTRLPFLTLSLWEQSVKNKKEIPKWRELDDFLTSRFQSLETVFDIRNTVLNDSDSENSIDHENYVNKSSKRYSTGSNSVFKGKVKTFPHSSKCVLCSGDHVLRYCSKFLEMNPDERFLVVKKHNLCINCLADGHKLDSCSSKYGCLTCKLKHNFLLHRDSSGSTLGENSLDGPSTSQAATKNQAIQNCFAYVKQSVLLGTAVVRIASRGKVFFARALIDSGSQATFISESLHRRLNLPAKSVNARISGLNGVQAGSAQKQCSFVLGSNNNADFRLKIDALVLPKITSQMPVNTIDVTSFDLSGIKLADPQFAKRNAVDILIGADYYSQVMLDGVKRNIARNIMAQETIFGWILTGPIASTNLEVLATTVSHKTAMRQFKNKDNNKPRGPRTSKRKKQNGPRASKYMEQKGPRSSRFQEQSRPRSSKSSTKGPSSSDGNLRKSEVPSTSQALVHNGKNSRDNHKNKSVVCKCTNIAQSRLNFEYQNINNIF